MWKHHRVLLDPVIAHQPLAILPTANHGCQEFCPEVFRAGAAGDVHTTRTTCKCSCIRYSAARLCVVQIAADATYAISNSQGEQR